MSYILDYQYIMVITKKFYISYIMVYPEKKEKITLLVFLILWIIIG